MNHQILAGFESLLEIMPVEEFAGERTRFIADFEVVHPALRSRIPDQAAPVYPSANGVDAARSDVTNFGEVNPVFVAERQIPQQVFKCAQPALGENFRAARAHARQVQEFGCRSHGHFFLIPFRAYPWGASNLSV